MRTRASYRSHPIHPALIPYPIAFLHSAFACDLAGRLAGRRRWCEAGAKLARAGIAAGLLAAIPGLVDYLYSVPPASSGKKRATKHMLTNAGALALFALAQWLRRRRAGAPGLPTLGLEAAGTGLLVSGAWMGSTLIHRNFMGPEHRYAEAGKWKETTVPERPGVPVTVAREDELEVDQMKLLRVDGRRIALARSEDGFFAFDDHCTHRGGSLADGVLICNTVQCLWHGSQFDVRTGAVMAGPAAEAIRTYPVEVVDGEVRLILDAGATFTEEERRAHGAEYAAGSEAVAGGAVAGGRTTGRAGARPGGAGVRGEAPPRV